MKPLRSLIPAPFVCAFLLSLAPAASAILVQFDYSYDAANGNFFGQNAAAKTALETAALDVMRVLNTHVGTVPTDVFTGSGNGATVKFDWSLTFPNPANGSNVTLQTFTLPADTVIVRVGMRPLSGTTVSAGAAVSASLLPSIVTSSAQGYAAATSAAQAASDAVMARGADLIMGSVSGSFATASYTAKYGSFGGSIWFDNDWDGNGLPDSSASLLNHWHLDGAAAVPADKYDLYTAATRELIKALGFGSSQSWRVLAQGTTWTGANVDRLFAGSGADLITTQGYITPGLSSSPLFGGAAQEALLVPDLAIGTRKYITNLDAAFLQDLGYQAIPEPSALALLGTVGGFCGLFRLRARRVAGVKR